MTREERINELVNITMTRHKLEWDDLHDVRVLA